MNTDTRGDSPGHIIDLSLLWKNMNGIGSCFQLDGAGSAEKLTIHRPAHGGCVISRIKRTEYTT